MEHLGDYDMVFPPMKNKNKEIDEEKLQYYKQFSDHAKKYMMDFKVSKVEAQLPEEVKKQPLPPPKKATSENLQKKIIQIKATSTYTA